MNSVSSVKVIAWKSQKEYSGTEKVYKRLTKRAVAPPLLGMATVFGAPQSRKSAKGVI